MHDHAQWDPANPENRDRTRESKRQMRQLLMEWDPIGVAGVEQAADEYDCMISPLMHRLFDRASSSALQAWISNERIEHFGLSSDEVGDADLARRLKAWWDVRTSEAI